MAFLTGDGVAVASELGGGEERDVAGGAGVDWYLIHASRTAFSRVESRILVIKGRVEGNWGEWIRRCRIGSGRGEVGRGVGRGKDVEVVVVVCRGKRVSVVSMGLEVDSRVAESDWSSSTTRSSSPSSTEPPFALGLAIVLDACAAGTELVFLGESGARDGGIGGE